MLCSECYLFTMENSNLHLLQLEGPENFNKWKFVLKTALEARGIWDIVEGKRKEPALVTNQAGAVTNQDDVNKWKIENARAKSMIIGTLAPRMLCHIETCSNADDVFKALKKVYSDASELNVQTTLQKFFSFKINENESAVEGALKIESLALSLKEMNEPVGNKMLIGRIVSALPPQRFGNFVEAWKSVAVSEQTTENLLARIKNIELQQKLDGKFAPVEGECQAFFSNHGNGNRGRENRGGRHGKWQPKQQQNHQQKKRCFNCDSENHLARDCDKKGNNGGNNGNNGGGRNGNGNVNRNNHRGGKGFRNKNRNKDKRAAHYNEPEEDTHQADDCAYGAEVVLLPYDDDDEAVWADVIPLEQEAQDLEHMELQEINAKVHRVEQVAEKQKSQMDHQLTQVVVAHHQNGETQQQQFHHAVVEGETQQQHHQAVMERETQQQHNNQDDEQIHQQQHNNQVVNLVCQDHEKKIYSSRLTK